MNPNMGQVCTALAGLVVERLTLLERVAQLERRVAMLEGQLKSADEEVTRLKNAEHQAVSSVGAN